MTILNPPPPITWSFFTVLNGIKSAGKVVWFTALFPYVILFILIGRGVTLPGAYEGLMFYLKPDFNKLKEPSVWFAAANQLVLTFIPRYFWFILFSISSSR